MPPTCRPKLVLRSCIWHVSITACRSPSFSICRNACAMSATGAGTTARSVRMSFASRSRNFAGRSRLSKREGFRHIFVMESIEEVETAVIERVPLWNDRTDEHGPFDIIGDVHGCAMNWKSCSGSLATNLAVWHLASRSIVARPIHIPPAARRSSSAIWWIVVPGFSIACGSCGTCSKPASGICVPGNHDMKLLKKLRARTCRSRMAWPSRWPKSTHCPTRVREPFTKSLAEFLDGLVSHYVLDGGKLVVAHAGLKEAMQGRGSGQSP